MQQRRRRRTQPTTRAAGTQGREKDYIAAQIRAWSHRKDAIDESIIAEYASRYGIPGGMTAGFNYYRALQEDIVFVLTLADRRLRMPVMSIAGQYGVGSKLAAALSILVSVILGQRHRGRLRPFRRGGGP